MSGARAGQRTVRHRRLQSGRWRGGAHQGKPVAGPSHPCGGAAVRTPPVATAVRARRVALPRLLPAEVPMRGDVLVFWRGSINGFQGQVGVYVGEDDVAFT